MSDTGANDPSEALRNYLLQADERAVFHALPRQIADGLNFEMPPTLELLVDAMFRGDAILHWELACPACQFRSEEPERLMLKIGIHTGPSIMVTLNDRLDYFGTTVNVAARVSDLAQGTQTLFTEPLQADSEVQAIVEAAEYDVVAFRSDIRGLDQELTVYCLVKSGTVADERSGWVDSLTRKFGIR